MSYYVDTVLFVHVPETEYLCDQLRNNPFQVEVTPIALADLVGNPQTFLADADHVVFSGPLNDLKRVLQLSMEYIFSVGLIPTTGQKDLCNCYSLPMQTDAALEIALQADAQTMDLILCNKKILLYKSTLGRLPMLDTPSSINFLQIAKNGLQRAMGMKLLPFKFICASNKRIKTATSGCMIVQHQQRTLASRIISHDDSLTDGMISMVITAPTSLLDYSGFLFHIFRCRKLQKRKRIPDTIGYIKSSQITIKTETSLEVTIDGEKATRTPVVYETIPEAVRINVGEGSRETSRPGKPVQERIEVQHLPTGKEVNKATQKRIPFFSYASEERFRDLFISLRADAETHVSYLVLMVLSTMLAAIGLYQSSTAVVIGAKLLAPLMAPIVALAMGLLRYDKKLSGNSIKTIFIGIIIALSAASLISLLFPHKPITMEMQARLNPSILDLAVAIVAGIAGAYTKSHKEILQSLAGVSIAVALVPPNGRLWENSDRATRTGCPATLPDGACGKGYRHYQGYRKSWLTPRGNGGRWVNGYCS